MVKPISPSYNVIFSRKAIKELETFPRKYQIKIEESIVKLGFDPFRLDLKKMHTSDATHRLRVGDYRLFLQINTPKQEIIVSTIKHRTTQTYR